MSAPYKITQSKSRKNKNYASWAVRFDSNKYKTLADENRHSYFKTKKDAEKFAEKTYEDYLLGRDIEKKHVKSFSTMYSTFLTEEIEQKYSQGNYSIEAYNRYYFISNLAVSVSVEIEVDDFKGPFGNLLVKDIRVRHVKAFYLALKNQRVNDKKGRIKYKKRSRKTIINYNSCLNQFFKWCVNNEFMNINPCAKGHISVPTLFADDSKKFDATLISEENILAIQENLFEDTFTQVAFMTAIKTGMRSGEQISLLWSDIDFDNQMISINKNLAGEGTKGDRLKTKHNLNTLGRSVPFDSELKQKLLEWRMESKYSEDSDHVFVRQGKRFEANNGNMATGSKYNYVGVVATNDTFKYILDCACAKAGVGRITWHYLRHYVASKLVLSRGDSKDDLKAISLFLGHSEVSTTERVYAHFIKMRNSNEKMQELANAL